jgi:DNA-3-methyladenine glycosylase I
VTNNNIIRCSWCIGNEIYENYHDYEWGVPVHDDNKHFEMIVLDGAQAGLSWLTVLKKRENYRKAFANFDPQKVARYDEDNIEDLLNNKGIIRNKQKIRSAIKNAKAFLEVQEKFGSFDKFIWSFVNYKTIVNSWENDSEIPTTSPESDNMSNSLKKLGFSFVGSTICYAYMQAAGMVNDHIVSCFRYNEINRMHQSKP